MRLRRVVVLLAALILWDWAPWVPPVPLLTVAQVKAQAPIPPPSAWHPYRGGTNCVQVADVNGNFSCSPLVTINPQTGSFSALGAGGAFSPVFGALVIAPSGNTLQALGNDLVIAKSSASIAPSGPGVGAATLRIRPSPLIPGYCRLVIAGGTSFGQEFAVALLNPASAYLGGGGFGIADFYVTDFPGGPGGC